MTFGPVTFLERKLFGFIAIGRVNKIALIAFAIMRASICGRDRY